MRVIIVDYGLCNLDSVKRAVEVCGGEPLVTDSVSGLGAAERIILPGVGSFAAAMQRLSETGWDKALRKVADEGQVPVLGICLGMQLFATWGEEGGTAASPVPGLGLIAGTVSRLEPKNQTERVPHVGWNNVDFAPHPLFTGIASGKDFYFVHSYALKTDRPSATIATTPYCGGFASAVADGNIVGTQFHPEKSQGPGLGLLRNFLGGSARA